MKVPSPRLFLDFLLLLVIVPVWLVTTAMVVVATLIAGCVMLLGVGIMWLYEGARR